MAAIVTVYGADGVKTRRPVGYPGGLCQVATAPYEAREIGGQTKKTPTPEAYEPVPESAVVETQQKIGG